MGGPGSGRKKGNSSSKKKEYKYLIKSKSDRKKELKRIMSLKK
jgi:hypothetical protein